MLQLLLRYGQVPFLTFVYGLGQRCTVVVMVAAVMVSVVVAIAVTVDFTVTMAVVVYLCCSCGCSYAGFGNNWVGGCCSC